MAFHSFTPETSTLANFKKFKQAGFNINHTVFKTNDQAQSALDLAQKSGIKMMIYTDELINDTDKTVRRFKNHPALFGYFLADEPSPENFPALKVLVSKIKNADKLHPVYVNLHPNYAPESYLNGLSYSVYVDTFLKSINVNFLSFDNYPIVNNKVRPDWYQNIEIIRSASLKVNKPFWAFACSTIHFDYKKPTLGGLKLQQFGNLLYGAKGLQYFTYITIDDEYWKKNNYSYSIVYNDGTPTPTYSYVKQVNKQVKTLSWIFMKSRVDSIYHNGDTIPIGTRRMNFLPKRFKKFNSYEKNALVSFMTSGKRKFVIIQNKDIFKPMPFSYQLQPGVSTVDNTTGKIKAGDTKENMYNIPPGDILIFTYL